MSSYSASVSISNGNMTVTRPYPGQEDVDQLVDSIAYAVGDTDNTITGVSVSIVTSDSPGAADGPAPADPPAPQVDDSVPPAAPDTAPPADASTPPAAAPDPLAGS